MVLDLAWNANLHDENLSDVVKPFARLPIRYLRNRDSDISGYRFRRSQFGMRNPLMGDIRNSQKCASLATNYLVFWQPDAIVTKYIFSGVPWRVRTT